MTVRVQSGNTVTFTTTFLSASGSPVDVNSVVFRLYNANKELILSASDGISHDGTGVYSYSKYMSTVFDSTRYYAEMAGDIDGLGISVRKCFVAGFD